MPNDMYSTVKTNLMRRPGFLKKPVLLGLCVLVSASFFTPDRSSDPSSGQSPCVPNSEPFYGYSFLHPDIINKNGAYAPFFIKWDDYYEQYYFNRDIQREENIEEWIGRFCDQPDPGDVADLVYKSNIDQLSRLRTAAEDPKKITPLPYQLAGNTFAEMIALNGCTKVVEYLIYAKKCEPYVIAVGDGWTIPERDTLSMNELIQEGLGRFKQTTSPFLKLRYTYQILRLAHYSRNWLHTVKLFEQLKPQLYLKKPSIIYYWALGHYAGALQKLGRFPEAAYWYSVIFRHCQSKRTQAYRSWMIRNDRDWEETLKLCQTDDQRATLYIMRSGGSHAHAIEDMIQVYNLDPGNPQLDLLLVSEVQELEKVFLRTAVTDRKYGEAKGALRRQEAAKHLLDLQTFVRQVLREKKNANPQLWLCMSGYLELLAGDRYAAKNTFERSEKSLGKSEYDRQLYRQLEVWGVLLDILNLDPSDKAFRDDMAFRIRSLDAFKYNPHLEQFLQDWLSTRYADSSHPGKAILAAYPLAALGYNPNLEVLDDLLRLAAEDNPVLLEKAMKADTNSNRIRARLLEIKGAYLLSIGEPEAALLALRDIRPVEDAALTKFSPFREKVGETVHRGAVFDSLFLNRRQIAEKILDFEFRAKAAEAVRDTSAAWYYYLIGLGYYNMSYFGYEWEVLDFYRSGYNQLRLAQGPVFSLNGSPDGNRENTDVSLALSYFERAYQLARGPEMAARAAFMAARCQQKQWFCDEECKYRPGSKLIPVLPDRYMTYYNVLMTKYANTHFYTAVVKECKWLAAYAR